MATIEFTTTNNSQQHTENYCKKNVGMVEYLEIMIFTKHAMRTEVLKSKWNPILTLQ